MLQLALIKKNKLFFYKKKRKTNKEIILNHLLHFKTGFSYEGVIFSVKFVLDFFMYCAVLMVMLLNGINFLEETKS